MNEILNNLGQCIEVGKIDKVCSYPPDMKGQDGADELTKKLLIMGLNQQRFLKMH